MKLTVLSAEDLRAALPVAELVAATKQAFADLTRGRARQPQRVTVHGDEDGLLLVKPAAQTGRGIGVKLVSVFPRNATLDKPLIHGLVALFDPVTGEPRALLEGGFLTAARTGAASGAASDLLARADAKVAAIFGCGVQARAQAVAVDAVRDLEEIRVFCRSRSSVEGFVAEYGSRLRCDLVAASSPRAAIDGADIVCTATTSSQPVFDGTWLLPGCHINGVGSFTADSRELDSRTVGRATVFVDSRASAVLEAGDLLLAEAEGWSRREDWVELGAVAAGRHPGRAGDLEITLFKSVGVAVQDVAAACLALDNAERLGLGQTIEI